MKIERVLVTPEIAATWLANNTKNRNVSVNRLTRYVSEMQNGRWKADTGETIKIAKDRTLLDGQHRLMAIVKSKVSVYLHVMFDMEKDIFAYIDTGKSRSSADVLTVESVKNATKKAAFIQAYHLFKSLNSNATKGGVESTLTPNQVLAFYNDNVKFVDETINRATVLYSKFQRVLEFGLVAFFTGVLSDVDKRIGDSFMRELCEGVDVTNDSIIVLRNRLISEKLSVRKTSKSVIRALIIKAWNAYYLNKTIKVLKFNPETEEYPEILGLNKD